ncbi:MAG: hypothetical protein J5918_07650 [Prevotella sp.]|nr:hypothetical protein [Prevotella sp.]
MKKERKRNKTQSVRIRLNEEEAGMFKTKSKQYKNMSAMVRDAVYRFDETSTIRKIEAFQELTQLYKLYQVELSRLGGNFNQTVKRANQLAIGNELTTQYFEKILFPKVKPILSLLRQIKKRQDYIVKKINKL